jgi:hypothetical protein
MAIAFVTLFLGLVHWTVPLRFAVSESVATVEVFLDDEKVVDLGPPFEAVLEIGPELVPREVVAVARARHGRRLGEARQWINRPRPGAEASFVVERDGEGRHARARLVWRRISGAPLASARVYFDGLPVDAPDLLRIAIPGHAPSLAHVLLADLTFGDGTAATAVASFGGESRGRSDREPTGFPVRVAKGRALPSPGGLAGWFAVDGRHLAVAAVEEGPSEVGFVLAGRAQEDLGRLDSEDDWPWPFPPPKPLSLGAGTRFRFTTTQATKSTEGEVVRLFTARGEFEPKDGRVLRLAATADLDRGPTAPAIAEAVAVSAIASAGRERRRAVALVLGAGATEMGTLDPARVRRYLSRLHVPLFVWRVSEASVPAAGDRPSVADATTVPWLIDAFHALRTELASQRIIWVEGRVEPSRISITDRALGVSEAR